VTCVGPQAIEAAIEEAAARTDLDALIIGGGDGTQGLAAAKLAGKAIALGVLPFGTVNLLGRDLGIPLEIDKALAALTRAEPVRIDLAEVNGQTFHSLLGLGFFARLAHERQRARHQVPFARSLAFGLALMRALLRFDAMRIVIATQDGERAWTSSGVLVTNNPYRESPVRRARLDEGTLDINIVRGRGPGALLRAGKDLVSGYWRRGESIEQIAAREVTITTRAPRVHASVDGENVVLTSPLKIRVRPQALAVLKPHS
jgi:diacylglycerol kinase family enzyme